MRVWGTRALLAIGGVFVVLLVIGKVMEFGSLPKCESQAARDMLSNVLKANKVDASSYNYRRTVTTSEAEVTCVASLALSGGGDMEVDYRFYWDGREKKYEVTRMEPAAQP